MILSQSVCFLSVRLFNDNNLYVTFVFMPVHFRCDYIKFTCVNQSHVDFGKRGNSGPRRKLVMCMTANFCPILIAGFFFFIVAF